MEPFELTLNQVNFEEKDLSPTQTLHSFSNLVNYDSDFKDDDNDHGKGIPITTRQFSERNASGNPERVRLEEAAFLAEKQGQYSNTFHTISVVQANTRTLPMDKSTAIEPRKDSFKAFTDTVEALALQKSVIGGSNIKPASAEEIAKAIAEAQAKIAGGQVKRAVSTDVESTYSAEAEDEESLHRPEVLSDVAVASGLAESNGAAEFASLDGIQDIMPAEAAAAQFMASSVEMRAASHAVTAVKSSLTISSTETSDAGLTQDVKRAEYEALQATQDITQIGVHRTKGVHKTHKSQTVMAAKVNASKKRSLIRIRPQDVTTVTERGATGRTVPSEKIKPANFPTNALSLIMPQELGYEDGASASTEESDALMQDINKADQSFVQTTEYYANEGQPMNKTVVTEGQEEVVYTKNLPEMTVLAEKIGRIESQKDTTHIERNAVQMSSVKYQSASNDTLDGHIHQSHESKSQFNGQDYDTLPSVTQVSTTTNVQNVYTIGEKTTVKMAIHKTVQEELKDEDVFDFMGASDTISDSSNTYEDSSRVEPMMQSVEPPKRATKRHLYALDKPDLTVPEMKKADFKLPDFDPESLKLQFSEYSPPKEVLSQKRGSLVSDATYDSLREELTRVLKENAKLEGQLEMLSLEARIAIKERAELQAQVAGMKSQLQAHQRSASSAVSDRESIETELHTLRHNHGHLEKVIINAQRVIESKDVDYKALQEELQLVKDQKDDFQDKVVSLKKEMAGQESKVVDFKNKITELYVEYQMSNQAKILAENEIKSLQSEIRSLQSSQNWYQEQLQQLQDGKTEMQEKISSFQSKHIENMTLIERLKAENVRIKQQVTDAQQKALNEKNILAHHLEVIEADMIEREAAFSQLQQQRLSLEQLVNNEDIKARQIEDMASVMELQEEIGKLKNESRRRKAQVSVLEHEQTELVKRLTLSQESILDRDKTIDDMDKKLIELQVHCQTLETSTGNKDTEISRLTNLSSTLEDDLKAAKEQKVHFDEALSTLKEDMIKVESNFKKMKNDLAQKEIELSTAMGERKTFEQMVESLRSEIAMLTARQQQQVTQLQSEIERQQTESEKLQQSALPHQEELSKKCQHLEEEKVNLISNLHAAQEENRNLQQQWQDMQTQLMQSSSQVSATSDKCSLLEKQLLQSQQESAQLHCQLTEFQSAAEELLKLREEHGQQQTQLSRAVEENQAYKKKSEDLEKYLHQQQESHKKQEQDVSAYMMQVQEMDVRRSNTETGLKTAMENLQQRSDADMKAKSEYITSLESEVSNLKIQCSEWQTQLKVSAQKLEEYDLLKLKVKSLEEHVQNTSEQEVKEAKTSEKQEQSEAQMVTLDAHIEEVNALRLEIQSLNAHVEELEAMKEKLKFLEGEKFTVGAVSDELEETKVNMENMQMEIDEWKKVVEVMQHTGAGDDDSGEKENVKSEVDMALKQMKKLHDMEMEELQQKLAEKEEMLEGYQKSGRGAPSPMSDDEDEMPEETDLVKKMSLDDLRNLMHHQSLTVEQVTYLITSLGYSPIQLQQLTPGSEDTIQNQVNSGGDLSTERALQVLNNLNLSHEQLLIYLKAQNVPQEQLLTLIQFNSLKEEQVNRIISEMLTQVKLFSYLQSLDIPGEQLLALAKTKLTEEHIMQLVLSVTLSEEHVVKLVQAQNMEQEKLVTLVQSLNLQTENLLQLLQPQRLTQNQLTNLILTQDISQDVVFNLVQSRGLTNEQSRVLVQQLGSSVEQSAPAEVHKQPQEQQRSENPTWEQVQNTVQSQNVSQEQLLQLLMAVDLSNEVLLTFMLSKMSEELWLALLKGHGLSQEHVMTFIQQHGLPQETAVSLLQSQTLTHQNIVTLLQNQKLSPEQVTFVIQQSGMTEEQLVGLIKSWNMSSDKLVSLAYPNGFPVEMLLSILQSPNLSHDHVAALVHSMNLSQEIVFSLVQAQRLTQDQLKWLVQKHISQEHVVDVLASLQLSNEQLVMLIQKQNLSEEQCISLVQSMNVSQEVIFNLVQSKGLSQEQVASIMQQQCSPEQVVHILGSQTLTNEQLLPVIKRMSDEQRLTLVQSLNLSQESLTLLVQRSQPQQVDDVVKKQEVMREEAALVKSGQVQEIAEEPAMVHSPNAVKQQVKTLIQSQKMPVEERVDALMHGLSEEELVQVVQELNISQEHLLNLINVSELQPQHVFKVVQSWLPQEKLVEVVRTAELPQDVVLHLAKAQLPQQLLLEAVQSSSMTESQLADLIEAQDIPKERVLELVNKESQVGAESAKVPESSQEQYLQSLQGKPLSAEQILTLIHSHEVVRDLLSILIPAQKLTREDFEQFVEDAPDARAVASQSEEWKEQIQSSDKPRDESIIEFIESQNISIEVLVKLMQRLPDTQRDNLSERVLKFLEETKLDETRLIAILKAQELTQEQIVRIMKSLQVAIQPAAGQEVAPPHGQLEGQLTVQSEGLSDERLAEFLEAYNLSQGQLMNIIRSQLSQEHLTHMLDNLSQEESQKIAEAETKLQIQAGGSDEEGKYSKMATTETTKHLTFALNTLEQLETELKTLKDVDMSQPLSEHWNKISNWITLTIKCVIEVKNVYKYYIEEKQVPSDTETGRLETVLTHVREENEMLKQRILGISNQQLPQVHSATTAIVANSDINDVPVAEIMAEIKELRNQLEESSVENQKLRDFQLNISKAVGLEIVGCGSMSVDVAHSTALSQLHRYIEQLSQQSAQMGEQIGILVVSLKDLQEGSQERSAIEAQIQELRHMAQLIQAAKIKLEAAMTSVQDTCGLTQVTQQSVITQKTVNNEEVRELTNESQRSAHQPTHEENQTYTAESETDSEKEIRHLRERLRDTIHKYSLLERQLKHVREYITGYFSHGSSLVKELNASDVTLEYEVSASPTHKVQLEIATQTEPSEERRESGDQAVTKEKSEMVTTEASESGTGDGSFKYYDKSSNSFDRGITHLIQTLEIKNEIKQFLHKELSVIIYENHQVKKSVYDEKVNEILQKLLASTNEVSKLKEVLAQKESSYLNSSQQIKALEDELADLTDQKSQLEVILQEANKSIREMGEQLLSAQQTHNTHVEKTTEVINQWQEACNLRDQQLQVFHHQILELQKEMETQKAENNLQKTEMTESKSLALELEKERGRLAGVMQSYTALKDHAATLEAAMARQESSVTDLSSTSREELEKRNKLITQLEEKITELEESVLSEKSANKDAKKLLMTEKGAHIKSKRLAESLQQEQKQGKADLELAQEELAKTVVLLEETREKERSLTVALEDAKSKIQALQTELERLRRELNDKQGKDPIMQEKIKTLEWELSQRTAELEATQNRVELIEDRNQMEVVNIQRVLQTSNNDMKTLREELAAVKQEKVLLQAKVAELRANLEVSSVQNKVFQFQKNEIATKEEITSVGATVVSTSKTEGSSVKIGSKPLSFLQDTLNSLRGEISNLQLQVDEHTCAVQSSSQAWKDLEVQVKDLRQLCKTSAADRSDKTTTKKREPPPMVHLPMLSPPE